MTTEIDFANKKQCISYLTTMFEQWNKYLLSLTEKQAISTSFHPNRSLKDDVGHLWVWQRVSVARMEAAKINGKPDFTWWPKEYHEPPELEEEVKGINEWIFKSNQEKRWSEIFLNWKNTFSYLITLSKQADEKTLLEPAKFGWLDGFSLMTVLSGTYNHHKEHLEKILGKEIKINH